MPSPPQLICRELPDFDSTDLNSIRAAFQNAEACHLGQTWLPALETDFAPAFVRTGWRDNSLLIFAELTDADIFTRATDHHQRLWELGDTFEIFLRPVEQQSYMELHVTPNNLRLQLRFPNAGAVEQARKAGSLEHVILSHHVFQSTTWLEPKASHWQVFAEISASAIQEKPKPLPGSKWFFSFSRYDDTRGRKEPVISSTSPHPRADFHRQEDWGALHFAARSANASSNVGN